MVKNQPKKNILSGIKAVTFDVGGTLLDPTPSVGHLYARVARKHGLKAGHQLLNRRFKSVFKSRATPDCLITKSWWRSVVRDTFKPVQDPLSRRIFNDIYEIFRKKRSWKVHKDVRLTLLGLKNRGIILAVASNWDARLPDLLRTTGLARYFTHQFISSRLKLQKPDPKFFQACLSTLKLRPDQVLHVGDNPKNDYHAPRRVGIKAVLIERSHDKKSTRRLSSLKDLLK